MDSSFTRVEKPWGEERIFAVTKDYVGKVLIINEGHQLSLQYHKIKEETIYVQSGELELLLEDDNGEVQTYRMSPGQSAHIAPQKKHRMRAISNCSVFEVSTPHLEDVVRLDDSYGRTDGEKQSVHR